MEVKVPREQLPQQQPPPKAQPKAPSPSNFEPQNQFRPFEPAAFDIGPFNLPARETPFTPRPDIIEGIAANIRAALPVRDNTSTPQLPPPPASDLVAGAEKSLVGVPKFDSADVKREFLLGGGTFASVWKGEAKGEVVAIKDMSYRSDKEVDMWKREVQLLSCAIYWLEVAFVYPLRHLQHYNYLVKIRGYLISKEHLSIVMDFMEGGSLYDIVHKKGNVPWSMLQKAHVFEVICWKLIKYRRAF